MLASLVNFCCIVWLQGIYLKYNKTDFKYIDCIQMLEP